MYRNGVISFTGVGAVSSNPPRSPSPEVIPLSPVKKQTEVVTIEDEEVILLESELHSDFTKDDPGDSKSINEVSKSKRKSSSSQNISPNPRKRRKLDEASKIPETDGDIEVEAILLLTESDEDDEEVVESVSVDVRINADVDDDESEDDEVEMETSQTRDHVLQRHKSVLELKEELRNCLCFGPTRPGDWPLSYLDDRRAKNPFASKQRRRSFVPCDNCGSRDHNYGECPKPPKRTSCYFCDETDHQYEQLKRCNNFRCFKCGRRHPGKDCLAVSTACGICGLRSHLASMCSDLWRRFHNTETEETPVEPSVKTDHHLWNVRSYSKPGKVVNTDSSDAGEPSTSRASIPELATPVKRRKDAVLPTPVWQGERSNFVSRGQQHYRGNNSGAWSDFGRDSREEILPYPETGYEYRNYSDAPRFDGPAQANFRGREYAQVDVRGGHHRQGSWDSTVNNYYGFQNTNGYGNRGGYGSNPQFPSAF